MKRKFVVVCTLLGVILPAVAAPVSATLENQVMRTIAEQQKRGPVNYTAQFDKLRKLYPTYEKQISAIEQEHNNLLLAARKSLVKAHHDCYYLSDMKPVLENLYTLLQQIKNPARKECITVLNHGYEYPTVRDNQENFSYVSNLSTIAKKTIAEEKARTHSNYAPKWALFYNQFNWSATVK